MAERFKFTKKALNELPAPLTNTKYKTYYDLGEPGLCIRVAPSGIKTLAFCKKIQGYQRDEKICRWPGEFTIEEAREKARQLRKSYLEGADPHAGKLTRRGKGPTLDEILERYIAIKRLKESTADDYRKVLKRRMGKWMSKPLNQLGTKAIEQLYHQELEALRKNNKTEADLNKCMRYVRAVWNYAKANGDEFKIPPGVDNPTRNIKSIGSTKRKKSYLRDSQLPLWFNTVTNLSGPRSPESAQTASDILIFLLFSGVRLNEATCLTWDNVHLDDEFFILRNTKSNQDTELPLNSVTHEIIKKRYENTVSNYVFPSENPDKPMKDFRYWDKRVAEISKIKCTHHDLRRTFSTHAEGKIDGIERSRLLGHSTIERNVTVGYSVRRIDRLKEASQVVADSLLDTINEKSGV